MRIDPKDKDAISELMKPIEEARVSRQHFAPIFNEFLELAWPDRQHIGKGQKDKPRTTAAQEDIFDQTLQSAVKDFASDMNDEFTPGYKPWTKHEPTAAIDTRTGRDQVKKYVDQRMSLLYGTIRQSSFEEASQDMWQYLAMCPGAMDIYFSRAGTPVLCEPIPIHELLILPGPFGGVDHRWRERNVEIRHLDTLWPGIDWDDVAPSKFERQRRKGSITVINGGYRDWEAAEETWHWYVIANNKIRRHRTYVGRGSCPRIVARTHVSSPTAYGVGPANEAIAPARTLNYLNEKMLKRVGRQLDPPTIFSDDGTFNPEGGMDDGDWFPAGEGFQVQQLFPQGDSREVWFEQEDLRMMVRRALFQDKPFQRGDTPPTAAQWLSEEAMAARRMAFPRARLHEELVLPVIRRFEWILEKRGLIEPIEIEGNLVNLEPVSPLSRSADIEDAQIATQFLQVVGASMPEGLARIDQSETLSNLSSRMGSDKIVKVLSEEEFQQRQAAAVALQAGAGALGEG
jgi:hypothetical protein